jgi:hypothetical protein
MKTSLRTSGLRVLALSGLVCIAIGSGAQAASAGVPAKGSEVIGATPSGTPSGSPTPSRPPVSPADLYDPGAVTDNPPAPTNNLSFTYTASRNISPTKYQTIYTGCPAGWYVRPGQPSAWTSSVITAAYNEDTGPDVDNASNDGTADAYPTPGDGHVFQNFNVEFHNWSLKSSHHASVTFWCDKLPSWYANPGTTPPATVQSGVKRTPAGGVGPNCYYCTFNLQFTNLSTGQALDPSGAVGAPVLVQAPTGTSSQNWYLEGQSGGSEFVNGIATFGLWQQSNITPTLQTAIEHSGGGYSFVSASNNVPQYGRFTYVDWGAGQVYDATMLVETDTMSSTSGGSGGLCIEADGTAGTAVSAQPCDATNNAQWWAVGQAK